MGQSQTQCFRFEAVNADGSPIKPQEQPTQPDFKDFVKMSDMNTFGFATMDDIKKYNINPDFVYENIKELHLIKEVYLSDNPISANQYAQKYGRGSKQHDLICEIGSKIGLPTGIFGDINHRAGKSNGGF